MKKALEQLNRFAEKAFRRPLNESDRKRVHDFYSKRIDEKAEPRQAALDTLKLILCSPSFFYLSEITPEDDQALKPFDLASRLSYALWAGPPDGELLAMAASGKLTEEEAFRRTSKASPKRRSFEGVCERFFRFLAQSSRDLGGMPPPRERARRYYSENLAGIYEG